MTKAALKRKNARLIEKRDQMNALIDNTEQEIKELDSRESRELLEKFHIESEELEKLILLRHKENKEGDQEPTLKKSRGRKSWTETGTETETEAASAGSAGPRIGEVTEERGQRNKEPGDTDVPLWKLL
jgi:hypothetical protein